jgi:hypothetical protein
MFGLVTNIDGLDSDFLGTIHAIDGMLIRSREGGMTYNTTMNNGKHENQVNRVP